MIHHFKIGLQVKNEVVEVDALKLYDQLQKQRYLPSFYEEKYSILLQSLPNYIRESIVNWADLRTTHKTHIRMTAPALLAYLSYVPPNPVRVPISIK